MGQNWRLIPLREKHAQCAKKIRMLHLFFERPE